MTRARRNWLTGALLALLIATCALAVAESALSPQGYLYALWLQLPKQWPDPPVGALVFAAVGWCVLVRRRSSRPRTRDSKFND
jgi:hypothetical protein